MPPKKKNDGKHIPSTLTEKNRAVYEGKCEYYRLRRLTAEARRTVNRCKGEDKEATEKLIAEEADKKADAALRELVIITNMTKNEH